MAKKVNENWGALGKAALKAASPMLKKNGKKMFNKAAKGAIKKFGKNATRQIVNGAKQLAQDPEVQQAALEMGKKGLSALKNKFMSKPAQQQMLPDEEAVLQQQQMQAAQQPQPVQQPQQVQQPVRRKAQQPAQPTQEQLIENWSKIVDKALNEAWGAALKGATTAGKALLKGAKAAGKAGKVGSKSNMVANVGNALVDDAKSMAKNAWDATPMGLVQNTLKDENGNMDFNLGRGLKKNFAGAAKTADDLFLGGLGQMAYNGLTGNGEEENPEEVPQEEQAAAQNAQQPAQQAAPAQQTQQPAQPAQQAQQPAQQPQQQAAPAQQPAQQQQQAAPAQPVKKAKKPVQQPAQQQQAAPAQQPQQQPVAQ